MTNQILRGYTVNNHSICVVSEQDIKKFEGSSLIVKYRTWVRDSHELYDYESNNVQQGQHLISGSCQLIRTDLEIAPKTISGILDTSESDLLLSVKARKKRYYIIPAELCLSLPKGYIPRKMWLVTRFLEGGVYSLREGDVIKLGRFKLRVKLIVPEKKFYKSVSTTANDDTNSDRLAELSQTLLGRSLTNTYPMLANLDDKEVESSQCRFCLVEGNLPKDPLLKACKCKGSIMYIHLTCLQHWVKNKLNITDDCKNRTCIYLKPIFCELCNTEFPPYIHYENENVPVLELPEIVPPYIIFENLSGSNNNKGFHLCSLSTTKECKLGRGHESDLRIADVSISRWHATVRYEEGKFLLGDHESKFGTLVALKKTIILEETDTLTVQVGRSVMALKVN